MIGTSQDAEEFNVLNSRTASRLPKSSVHQEYIQSSYIDNDSVHWTSKCKHCGHEILHKRSCDLKSHLERLHPEVYKEMEIRDQKAGLLRKGLYSDQNIEVKERRKIKPYIDASVV